MGTSSCSGLFCEMQRLYLGKQRGYGFTEVWCVGFVLDGNRRILTAVAVMV